MNYTSIKLNKSRTILYSLYHFFFVDFDLLHEDVYRIITNFKQTFHYKALKSIFAIGTEMDQKKLQIGIPLETFMNERNAYFAIDFIDIV